MSTLVGRVGSCLKLSKWEEEQTNQPAPEKENHPNISRFSQVEPSRVSGLEGVTISLDFVYAKVSIMVPCI